MPVAMCSPAASSGSGAPWCAPFASDPAPYVGTTITVFAHCTGNPAGFAWSGCSSASGQCSVTATSSGTQTYTVVATNAGGSSAPASVSVSWRNLPPPPVCSLLATANSDLPTVNTPLLLTAVCTGSPTGYSWARCSSIGTSRYTTSA